MITHAKRIRGGTWLATASSLALAAGLGLASVPAVADTGEQEMQEMGIWGPNISGGGLEPVAFERGIDRGALGGDECPYWDVCSGPVPVAVAQDDPYAPGGALEGVRASEGGLQLVVFERDLGANGNIALPEGFGVGLNGEPPGASIGANGME